MTMASNLLERAIALSRAGKKQDARQLLTTVIQAEPKNAIAWSWYVDTFSALDERIKAVEQFLKIDPTSQSAQKAHVQLLKAQIDHLTLHQKTVLKPRYHAAIAMAATAFCIAFAMLILDLNAAWQINALSSQTSNLQSNYDALSANYASTQSQYTALQGQYASLHQELVDLRGQYTSLQQQYNEVSGQFAALKEQAIVPPYISVRQRTVTIAFKRLDDTIDHWTLPFDTLEKVLDLGGYTRSIAARASAMLRLHAKGGQTYSVEDMSLFVDPTSFSNVIPDLYHEAGNDDKFIRETWNIVTQLALYSNEIGEIPRYPLETLLAGGGDCEDTAILFSSMILAAPVNWKVQLVYLDINNPRDPQDVNHVIVYVDTGQATYLVDTTTNEAMQPYTDGVVGWFFDAKKS